MLDNISPSTVIPVGNLYDLRIMATKNVVGFVCVPQGETSPAAASPLPE